MLNYFMQKVKKSTKGGTLTLDFPTSGSFKPPTLVHKDTISDMENTEVEVGTMEDSYSDRQTNESDSREYDAEVQNPMLDYFESKSMKENDSEVFVYICYIKQDIVRMIGNLFLIIMI